MSFSDFCSLALSSEKIGLYSYEKEKTIFVGFVEDVPSNLENYSIDSWNYM